MRGSGKAYHIVNVVSTFSENRIRSPYQLLFKPNHVFSDKLLTVWFYYQIAET
jgi:hypothetical protein